MKPVYRFESVPNPTVEIDNGLSNFFVTKVQEFTGYTGAIEVEDEVSYATNSISI